MIEPITATPMVEPMERKKVSVAVTSPSCRYGKAFWTTMVKRLIMTPIPRPVTTMLRTISPSVVVGVMRESKNMPTAATANPMIASIL